MHPILFYVGPFPVTAYGFMAAMGIIAGTAVVLREGKRLGYDVDTILDLALYMSVAGVVGSRLAYILLEWTWADFVAAPLAVFHVWEGGLSFFGALALCLVVAAWYAKRKRIRLIHLGDLLALGVAAGYPFGRIGCFLNGCCHGQVTTGWWGVSVPFDHVLRHPTQLYSAGFGILIFVVLWLSRKRKPFDGYLMMLYLVLYGAYRFVIDFWRVSPETGLAGLTTGQAFSLAVVLVSLLVLWMMKTRLPRG